jgi:hypothetical protein
MFELIPVEKRTIFPISKYPNPPFSDESIVCESMADKKAVSDAIKKHIGVQIAISELRRYTDAPKYHSFLHHIGLSRSMSLPEQTAMIGGLFSSAHVCATGGVPCSIQVAQPTACAIDAYAELLGNGGLNPMVSQFMGRETAACSATAAYRVIFDRSDPIDSGENDAAYTEFFGYFSDPLRNLISVRCIPTYGLPLNDILSDPALRNFGKSVRCLFVYTEKLVSYKTDYITFIAWHD